MNWNCFARSCTTRPWCMASSCSHGPWSGGREQFQRSTGRFFVYPLPCLPLQYAKSFCGYLDGLKLTCSSMLGRD